MKFHLNQQVHVDTDNAEWGRIASDGKVVKPGRKACLVACESVRANVMVPVSDIVSREANPDNDEFSCESCGKIGDIEDSVRGGKDILLCVECAPSGLVPVRRR